MSMESQVPQLIRGHLQKMGERRIRWLEYRAAYESEFWAHSNRWTRVNVLPAAVLNGGQGDPLPIKMEVNRIRQEVKTHLAGLFYKNPRVTATAPAIRPARRGRPSTIQDRGAELVGVYIDDWLSRKDFQQTSRFAYKLALMYGSSAYKVVLQDEGADITDRIFVEAVPPWEIIWDEHAHSVEKMRYIGHIRQESREYIEEMFGPEALQDMTGQPLVDYLEDELESFDLEERDESYFWLVEFYDLVRKRVYWMVGTGLSVQGGELRKVKETEMPFKEHTFVPVILEPRAEHPLVGMPVVDALYQKNAEENLILTIVANSMRVDAARKRLVRSGTLTAEAVTQLNSPFDSAWVEVDATVPFEQIFGELDHPKIGDSLQFYAQLLELSVQKEKGTADVAQGRSKPGTPISAQEANLLSQYSESATGLIAQGMDDAVAKVAELILMITSEVVGSLSIDHEGETHNLKAETLSIPWRITMTDSGVTPTQRAQDRANWLQVQPMLIELSNLASGGPPGEDGQPSVPEATRVLAQRSIDYIVDKWQLPKDFKWGVIASKIREGDAEKKSEVEALVKRLASSLGEGDPQGGPNQPAPEEIAL